MNIKFFLLLYFIIGSNQIYYASHEGSPGVVAQQPTEARIIFVEQSRIVAREAAQRAGTFVCNKNRTTFKGEGRAVEGETRYVQTYYASNRQEELHRWFCISCCCSCSNNGATIHTTE